VVNWYAEHAFTLEVKPDEMGELYPWLFGPDGLYGGMAVGNVEVCREPCKWIDGACECPE
jgi:hypothetical protein